MEKEPDPGTAAGAIHVSMPVESLWDFETALESGCRGDGPLGGQAYASGVEHRFRSVRTLVVTPS